MKSAPNDILSCLSFCFLTIPVTFLFFGAGLMNQGRRLVVDVAEKNTDVDQCALSVLRLLSAVPGVMRFCFPWGPRGCVY